MNNPASKVQYENLQLFWTIFEEICVDEGYAIPFREIYAKADQIGVVLTKKRILKAVQEKVSQIESLHLRISLDKTSKGFMLNGVRWLSSPGDEEITLYKIFFEGLIPPK